LSLLDYAADVSNVVYSSPALLQHRIHGFEQDPRPIRGLTSADDVFAFGTLLYEIFSGRLPLAGICESPLRPKKFSDRIFMASFHSIRSGTDVMTLKKISPKNMAKILACCVLITASFCKNLITVLVFEKTTIFCRKLAIIAENCDHNIDSRQKNH
jgi:hypothetical protein